MIIFSSKKHDKKKKIQTKQISCVRKRFIKFLAFSKRSSLTNNRLTKLKFNLIMIFMFGLLSDIYSPGSAWQ